jgi:PAS domain S-box-containing protein
VTKDYTTSNPSADTLRQRAEAKFRADAAHLPAQLPPDETQRLLHELQVHQIELELQNEELRRMQVELEASRAGYLDLYDLAPVGYLTLSEPALILEANLTAANLLGLDKGALVNQSLTRFIVPEDQDIYYQHHKHLFETSALHACELRLTHLDGSQPWVRVEAIAAQRADGAPICRAVISEITDRKQMEEELRRASAALETAAHELRQSLAREQQLARTDGLTGLYNRRQFFELAAREFSAAVRYSHSLTVLMFDADGFKRVNDTLGHAAGDQLLARMAQTAAAHTRTVDVLAR